MPHQVGLTVVAPVKPDALEDLRATLKEFGSDAAHNRQLPLGRLESTHFARFFLVEPATDLDGKPTPAQLVFMVDWDAPLDERLRDLVGVCHAGLDRLFSACEGYGGGGPEAVAAFMRQRSARHAAYYVNTVGLSAAQVIAEGRLRTELEDHLDTAAGLRNRPLADVRSTLADWVGKSSGLSWALQPASPPELGWRVRELAHLVVVPLLGLLLLPVVLVVLPFWLAALRIHENRDPAPDVVPDPRHVVELEAAEDHGPINPFTAVGFIKPGWFRAATTRIVLFLISYGVRHVFNRANLAGVKTIHFARWTFIDGGKRVIFASYYDGSQESYMDDFIDKVAWGLNAVFSNGVGYPPTRWLLFGGAHNERAFKHLLRVHQVAPLVWYTPYPDLSALNIANNSALRDGLRGELSEPDAAGWLGRL